MNLNIICLILKYNKNFIYVFVFIFFTVLGNIHMFRMSFNFYNHTTSLSNEQTLVPEQYILKNFPKKTISLLSDFLDHQNFLACLILQFVEEEHLIQTFKICLISITNKITILTYWYDRQEDRYLKSFIKREELTRLLQWCSEHCGAGGSAAIYKHLAYSVFNPVSKMIVLHPLFTQIDERIFDLPNGLLV